MPRKPNAAGAARTLNAVGWSGERGLERRRRQAAVMLRVREQLAARKARGPAAEEKGLAQDADQAVLSEEAGVQPAQTTDMGNNRWPPQA